MGTVRRIFAGSSLFMIIVFAGTYGIVYFEGTSIFDSFYHIFMTITTWGGTIPNLSFNGKIITMASIFFGMGSVIYIGTLLAKTVIEGQTRLFLTGLKGGIIRMKKMKNHIVVCGYGQLGKYVCQSLEVAGEKVLIIEKDKETCTSLLEKGKLLIQGDSLDSDVLKKAELQHAKAIIGTLSTDADNIYLMMTANDINPTVIKAAEARDEEAVKRLHKIGAQVVVVPKVVGGKQLAQAVMEVDKTKEVSTISSKKE